MFKEHNFVVWGTHCKCGNECSILQNQYHPWIDTTFAIKLKCSFCGNEVIVDRKCAEAFYNNKIYSYYNGLYGKVIDLGCGDGFLSRYILNQNGVDKVYGVDVDTECITDLADIINGQNQFEFINTDINNIGSRFCSSSVDFLVSRDVFMFVEDTERYFDDISRIVSKGVKQMGWYMKDNDRMKNKLETRQIADEYEKRGWTVDIEYLDWYKCGYFINAYRM